MRAVSGDDAQRNPVIDSAFPRRYNNDLNLRTPRHGPDGPLPGPVVWSGGANGATQEERRDPPPDARTALAAWAGRSAGVRRNLQEP